MITDGWRDAKTPSAFLYNPGVGVLYIVGTPIGNLEDLSLRAARVLGEVGLVAAEDTRVTRRLLSHLGARPRLLSFNEHNWRARLEPVLQALAGGDVALVSDAGMPGVSDPGRELVLAAAAHGFRVETVPGPSAVTTALSVSGFSGDSFLFLGFLPRRRKERQETLRASASSFASGGRTLVIFEAPHRVRATLADLAHVLGDRPIAVCRELTKLHEEVFRGTASQALERFAEPRGEFVLVVEGAADAPDGQSTSNQSRARTGADADAEISRYMAELRASGMRARDAVARTADVYGIPKNRAYALWLSAARNAESDNTTDGI